MSYLSDYFGELSDDDIEFIEVQRVAEIGEDLGFSLYRHLSASNDNLFFSPLNIFQALSMVYLAANGKTKEEIEKLPGFLSDQEEHGKAVLQLMQLLDKQQNDALNLKFANSIFANKSFNASENFERLLKSYLRSEINEVDFTQTSQAVEFINNWVLKNTNGLIKHLVNEENITDLTKICLISAMHFKGSWVHGFLEEDTCQDTFNVDEFSPVDCLMMNQITTVNYLKREKFKAIELPYQNSSCSCLCFLPSKHSYLLEFEKSFDLNLLEDVLESFEKKEVSVGIPKFSLRSNLELSSLFKEFGMGTLFSDEADLSGLGEQQVKVDNFFHQSFLSFDELGSEASAASAAFLDELDVEKEETLFIADRPFMFIILERESKTILFIGKLSNPVQGLEKF